MERLEGRLSGDTEEYLCLGANYSTLDGAYSSAELRAIADVMDRLKAEGCDNPFRMRTYRR